MALMFTRELGYSYPVYPFTFLSEYRMVVCQKYQYACLAGEIATHLAKKHPEIDLGARRQLVEKIKIIPNVLQSRSELSQLQYPPPTTEPIPCLAPPKLDVLKCRHCGFTTRQVQAMQEHCAKTHDWVNPRGKGRPSIGHLAADPLPWIEGVACQRLFPSREGSKWFQVSIKTKRPLGQSKKKPSAKKKQTTLENLTSEAYCTNYHGY
ncbi:hypothetical protein FOPG_20162 [Fusarium oxysporum f. sp. conglutinans race 2 54008]|uniref:Uncharacterized protein n=1 Tax=Fusarium oxysporum f. sp. conglutinans race 2 54008 TaxID=1089457 RepID=X0HQQ2_FUSOX|nr:hypothetical protein FOPG_20162 [Fusarium oxysporum f. sp. conglutinans race 2 54008]KAI8417041.1 hypothetical protein FOFC_03354 [Fusarium oxysporum]